MLLRRIGKLEPALADQISAGEVVERPASIVKEAVENSLDAGSKNIDISVSGGGLTSIYVSDDGHGIHEADLTLAIQRHATSKIKKSEDLLAISTLGFRGEALASIASVSRFKLSSRSDQSESGWMISTAGDSEFSKEPIAHNRGTTVHADELFFNVPARRKFLKSERAENRQIETVVKKISLAYMSVAFSYAQSGNPKNERGFRKLELQVGDPNQRLSDVLSPEFVENSIFLDETRNRYRLFGWIGLPSHNRAQRDQQFFYVNKRPVKDEVVNQAVRQAYRDLMYGRRHPVYVLFLEVPEEELDVNVHPTKQEVRYRDSRSVRDFIFGILHNNLAAPLGTRLPSLKLVSDPKTSAPSPSDFGSPLIGDRKKLEVNQLNADAMPIQSPHELFDLYRGKESGDVGASHYLGEAISQLHGTYILSRTGDGLVMVDMHAAHERVLYEEMKAEQLTFGLVSQKLLIPIAFTVSEIQANNLEEMTPKLLDMGFVVERLGQTDLVLREAPSILAKNDLGQMLEDFVADFFLELDSGDLIVAQNQRLGSLACRAAIKANQNLSLLEMNALLRRMETTENAGLCNHGRPTFVRFSMDEIDRWFLRGR